MGQSAPLNKSAVLVVEDEVLIRMHLVDLVEDSGFTVYEAGSADEAIQKLEAHPEICVLITDVDMPGSMDGLKLSFHVSTKWPPIKIYVASGHVRVKPDQLPERGIFIEKPFDTLRMRGLLKDIASEIGTC